MAARRGSETGNHIGFGSAPLSVVLGGSVTSRAERSVLRTGECTGFVKS